MVKKITKIFSHPNITKVDGFDIKLIPSGNPGRALQVPEQSSV
jgi:hypothetical protein